MFPNRFYTEWLVNEMVKLNKKLRESRHTIEDNKTKQGRIVYEKGYSNALVEVIEDLREVLNHGEEDEEE